MKRKGREEEEMGKRDTPKDLLKWRYWLFKVVLLLYQRGYVAREGGSWDPWSVLNAKNK